MQSDLPTKTTPALRAEDAHGGAEAAYFSSVMAVVLAVIAVASRAGFRDVMWEPVWKFLGLSWLLVHFPWGARILVLRACRRTEGVRNEAALALAGLTGVALLGWLAGRIDSRSLSWVAIAGLALGGLRGVLALPKLRGRIWKSFGLAMVAAFLGVYCAGAIWGSGYQNPLFVEQLATGTAKIDTLFHAAVCNMIRTYGVPSTGLDGAPFMHYHFGSHWLFAQICNLLDVAVIDFYNVGYAIVFAPFGVFCLLTFAREIGGDASGLTAGNDAKIGAARHESRPPAGRRTHRSFWFVLCLGYAGFLPLDAGFETPTARTSILVSESYAVAVAIAFLGLSAALRFYRQCLTRNSGSSLASSVAAVLVFPALLGVVGLCKISILLLLLTVGIYAFVRLKLYRSVVFVLFAISAAVFSAAVFRLAYAPGYEEETGWIPLGFLRENVATQWWAVFWLLYFAWVWILIALRCREQKIGTVGEFWAALRRRELFDVELTIVIAVAGAAPGLLLSRWSSMHYFSEYQQWIALGLVLATMARRNSNAESVAPKATSDLGSMSLRRLAVIGLGVVLAGTMILNTVSLVRQTVAINLASRGYPQGGTGVGIKLMAGDVRGAWEILCRNEEMLKPSVLEKWWFVGHLRSLDRLSLSMKRSTALFVPRSNRNYWEMLATQYSPRDVPLVGPALSGLAMVDGLYDPAPDDRWVGYGYQDYPRPPSGVSPRHFDIGESELCERAKSLGFREIAPLSEGYLEGPWLYDCP